MNKWILCPTDKIVKRHVSLLFMMSRDNLSSEHATMKLLPQASSHLIFSDKETRFNYVGKTTRLSNLGCHFLYPVLEPLTLTYSLPVTLLGIKFKPGFVYDAWGTESANYKNTLLPLDCLKDDKLEKLCEVSKEVFSCEPSEANLEKIELAIKEFIQWHIKEEPKTKLVKNSLDKLQKNSIDKVCKEIGCSRRTLERHFKEVTGFTLNQYKDTQILHNVVYDLNESKNINWLDIAIDNGFYDQPHFIKHFRKMLGVTPKEYLASEDEEEALLISESGKPNQC